MIRCTPLPQSPDTSYCRVPGAEFYRGEPCRACPREIAWAQRNRPTVDIRKPVRWLTVEELYSRPGVAVKRAAVIR